MNTQLDFAALTNCLRDLEHLFIDISRLTPEPGYEEQIGGYGIVRVSSLDVGPPGGVLVAAKKILLKDRHREPQRIAFRLARELKIWAGFRHPHVLPLMGYYLDKDYKIAVLISQYMIHGDLKGYINEQKPSWGARLHLMRDVTDGLAYLHQQSPPVLHGDLKMKNVLVSAARRGILADFGLSKALEEGPSGLTTSDGLKGTLRYYSPELIRDANTNRFLSSDIWAWGCLALEALADRIPYAEKRAEHSIIMALMNNEAPSDVESLSIPVPELKNLLGRCWAIQPSERSSAADCLQVIELALATNPWFTAPKAHVRVIDSSHVRLPERNVDLPRTTPRPFGVEDCPTFYPTVEEWKDPMAYITSISDRVRPCGICKVVPPEGWKMPFVMDRENFRFKTRLQRLNSIEVSSRAKINFLEQLYRFHQQQEAVGPVVPTINHKPLDLWLLRKEVYSRGGFDIVSRAKQWGGVARTMGYDGIVGVSTQLKNVYIRIILPFEQFSDHTRNSPSMSAVSPGIRYAPTSSAAARRASERTGASNQAHSRTSMPARNSLSKSSWPTFTSVLSIKSTQAENGDVIMNDVAKTSPGPLLPGISVPQDHRAPSYVRGDSCEFCRRGDKESLMLLCDSCDRGYHTFCLLPPLARVPKGDWFCSICLTDRDYEGVATTSTPLPRISTQKRKPSDYVQGDLCEVCNSGDNRTQILLCDGCDGGYHTFCLDPPLSSVPKGQWFCHICLFDTGGDYGFDEGEDHSLHSFQARDLAFRKAWFEAHRPPPPPEGHNDAYRYKIGDVELREDDVEREFWRLVESPLETVEIEYGADLHSTTHGSASPSLETHPLDPYSRDGWNMNNMARAPGSLLRYVKSDISGMTVPWVYVGMVFSTFCWHNEDHYTYSVNYMHWGETKTWYGIPGDDAEKFEAAIKSEAPDLFEAQPDLLFQLVTLMSPKRLKDAGVRVYGCNQRPGEYVIAFPKAYHAGFNHGFNLNEGVNFAIPNWLNYGRDSVRQYQEHQKLPVFSHEELLITITQHSTNIKTATWLLDSLREMIDGHLTLRKKLRQAVPNILEVTEEHDVPEDQYHCAVCKGFSYLAQVTCQCMKQVACLEHWTELCGCPHTNRTLRKRFDDQQLLAILHKVQERTTAPITSDLTPQVA